MPAKSSSARGNTASSAPTLPPTTKGRATRGRLETALRELLVDRPYSAVRIADIAERARLSPSAVYRYFGDRREILLTVLQGLTDDAFAFAHAPWDPKDPKRSVHETTLRYLQFYEQNRALFAVMAELAQSDDKIHEIWLRSQRAFHGRIQHAMERGIEQGVVRADVDPGLAAQLLGGMTEFYAYRRYVVGFADAEPGPEVIADAVTDLWARGAFNPAPRPRTRK